MNTDIRVQLKLVGRSNDPGSDERITIMERSLILVPLDFEVYYDKKEAQIYYPEVNQDIVFENINSKFFVLYTANLNFYEPT